MSFKLRSNKKNYDLIERLRTKLIIKHDSTLIKQPKIKTQVIRTNTVSIIQIIRLKYQFINKSIKTWKQVDLRSWSWTEWILMKHSWKHKSSKVLDQTNS